MAKPPVNTQPGAVARLAIGYAAQTPSDDIQGQQGQNHETGAH